MSHVKQSGGDSDYYLCKITHPKRLKPCEVECEDIIYALGMTFAEGEAFKATWRNAAMRLNNGKAGDSAIRNGQKVEHYGKGIVLETKVREFRDDEQNNEGDLVDNGPVKPDVENFDNLRYVEYLDNTGANKLIDDSWFEVESDIPRKRKFRRLEEMRAEPIV